MPKIGGGGMGKKMFMFRYHTPPVGAVRENSDIPCVINHER